MFDFEKDVNYQLVCEDWKAKIDTVLSLLEEVMRREIDRLINEQGQNFINFMRSEL